MSKYQVVTESGSVYELDTERKLLTRTAGAEAGKLHGDDEPLIYHKLLSELTVDKELHFMWQKPDGRWAVRTTTPVVAIERH